MMILITLAKKLLINLIESNDFYIFVCFYENSLKIKIFCVSNSSKNFGQLFCNLTDSAFERTSLPRLDALTHNASADRFCVTVIQISDVKWLDITSHFSQKLILHLLCSNPSISDYIYLNVFGTFMQLNKEQQHNIPTYQSLKSSPDIPKI
jgi:hypothetical protein